MTKKLRSGKARTYALPRHYLVVGEYLQASRKMVGLTQKNLSDALGYSSAQFISNFERGIALPPLKKLKLLVGLLSLNVDTLVEIILEAERVILLRALGGKPHPHSRDPAATRSAR